MRTTLLLAAALLSLSACSTARKAVGAVSNLGGLLGNDQPAQAPQTTAAAGEAETAPVAKTIIADDIKRASRGLPRGLEGDAKNILHSGDPVPPR
jgi:hypothetical protein